MGIAVNAPPLERCDDPVSALLELGLEGVELAATAQESIRLDRCTYRCWRVRPSMGTLVSVVALDASRGRVEDAIEQAFGEMTRLVGILSRHDSSTPLAHLNTTGRLSDAPPELLEVVGRARGFHWLTHGAFDVTVKPLVDLLRATGGEPAPAERAEAADLVGMQRLRLSGRRLSFDRAGMGLTLDGIAKGFVVDRMADALVRRGVRRFLINAGGDIRAMGGKEGGRPWTIGVRDPLPFASVCHRCQAERETTRPWIAPPARRIVFEPRAFQTDEEPTAAQAARRRQAVLGSAA